MYWKLLLLYFWGEMLWMVWGVLVMVIGVFVLVIVVFLVYLSWFFLKLVFIFFKGRYVVIIGGFSGIGLEVVKLVVVEGVWILFVVRDLSKFVDVKSIVIEYCC